MNKLFVIYIGGIHEKALIELHDMRFVIAESIEDTHEQLRKSWWGIPKSLHIDSWGALEFVDNYKIELSTKPMLNNNKKLYFINLGGYDPLQFTELHKNVFVVADDVAEAKEKAKKLISEWKRPHKDYLYEVENLFDVNDVIDSKKWHIELKPVQKSEAFKFTSDYIPLGKAE